MSLLSLPAQPFVCQAAMKSMASAKNPESASKFLLPVQ